MKPKTLTIVECSKILSNQLDTTADRGEEIVRAVFAEITRALSAGRPVKLCDYRFILRHRAARMGRNPKTNAPVKIPARMKLTVKFTGIPF